MSLLTDKNAYFMMEAYKLAKRAFENDEVPVGAVVVFNDKIIGRGYNQVEQLQDATAHAEMIAITAASNALGSKYLEDCTIYVTLEPCKMCATALFWSKVGSIHYAASDEKQGFFKLAEHIFNYDVEIQSGTMAQECSELVKDFFKIKRDIRRLL